MCTWVWVGMCTDVDVYVWMCVWMCVGVCACTHTHRQTHATQGRCTLRWARRPLPTPLCRRRKPLGADERAAKGRCGVGGKCTRPAAGPPAPHARMGPCLGTGAPGLCASPTPACLAFTPRAACGPAGSAPWPCGPYQPARRFRPSLRAEQTLRDGRGRWTTCWGLTSCLRRTTVFGERISSRSEALPSAARRRGAGARRAPAAPRPHEHNGPENWWTGAQVSAAHRPRTRAPTGQTESSRQVGSPGLDPDPGQLVSTRLERRVRTPPAPTLQQEPILSHVDDHGLTLTAQSVKEALGGRGSHLPSAEAK
ncbi:uncharacterized protein LOC109246041 isoform X4 [Panthera pardus]|uniref:Uncharacterized protein LOC109246041 isoform X4 n=1 Tax=Panthera pardus TaxID=9691 RepID=A0A9V1DWW5_PANPR|nr:uncharacterized protein LOC109246041 isoform X4 [Panthera pardus]